MPPYKVVISDAAREMLMEQVYFLATVNPTAAEALRKKMMGEIRGLAKMPERFPYLEPDNRKNQHRKMYVPNWYLVIYTVENDTVFVEYILDCRQNEGGYQFLLHTD